MRKEGAKPDLIVARTAARQHGVAALEQLRAAGLSQPAITRRVAAGRLHRVHRGVYAPGSPNLTPEGHFMAAVFACGDKAVLSHQSAAALWKLSPTCPPIVHVTVPGTNGRRRRNGIVVHRSSTLTATGTTIHRGIPVTTQSRTLRDLGLPRERTRSDLERDFLRLCRRRGIPKPDVNVMLGHHEVDFLWRDERLVVEVDSYRYHSGRRAFEADRARDRDLRVLGYVVLRFTDRELTMRPDEVVLTLRNTLSPPAAAGPT